MESLIEVNGLVKKYKELTAVDNLDLEVKSGEIWPTRSKWKWQINHHKLHPLTIKKGRRQCENLRQGDVSRCL